MMINTDSKYQTAIQKKVRQKLEKYYYELEVVESIKGYCVVVDRKSKSASILKNSVMRKHRG